MKCKKCGNKIENGSMFCTRCGQRVNNIENNVQGGYYDSINYNDTVILSNNDFDENENYYRQDSDKYVEKPKKKSVNILLIALIILFIAAIVVFFFTSGIIKFGSNNVKKDICKLWLVPDENGDFILMEFSEDGTGTFGDHEYCSDFTWTYYQNPINEYIITVKTKYDESVITIRSITDDSVIWTRKIESTGTQHEATAYAVKEDELVEFFCGAPANYDYEEAYIDVAHTTFDEVQRIVSSTGYDLGFSQEHDSYQDYQYISLDGFDGDIFNLEINKETLEITHYEYYDAKFGQWALSEDELTSISTYLRNFKSVNAQSIIDKINQNLSNQSIVVGKKIVYENHENSIPTWKMIDMDKNEN